MSISLRDAEGVFLPVDPATTKWEPEPLEESPVETGDTAGGDAGEYRDRENSELRETLPVAQAEQEEKVTMIKELKQQLEQERIKY